MEFHFDGNAAFTAALAIAAGVTGQSLGYHLRLPGIVILLALGVVLGPDVADVVQPASLGPALPAIVGFAVAIILFEGGMSLNLKRLRRQERAIRQLITVGALVSLIAGAVCAMLILGWRWQLSLLFGTLVIVTGPTVVTPLLRRLSVKKHVATVLEAEGVLIDAVGAITAAVALELVVAPSGAGAALALPIITGRLLFGVVFGALTGFALGALLRVRGVVPEGFESIVSLGFAVLIFEASNAMVHESGIAAVTIAGMVVGNIRGPSTHKVAEFQEQLTIMFIGMLFVLLVADVRIADIGSLGLPGVAVAVACIALVRPLSVWVGTLGCELTPKEKVFIGWIGPRGIVAAAVASLFGYELASAGIAGGTKLRALVFLVIAVTVLWSALTGGLMARALGLRRKSGDGWLIVGSNPLSRKLAKVFLDADTAVVVADEDPARITEAEQDGLRALHGNALSESLQTRAALDSRAGAIAVTQKEEVNYVFAEKCRHANHRLRFGVSLLTWGSGVTAEMVHEFGGEVFCGTAIDFDRWVDRCRDDNAVVQWWSLSKKFKGSVLTLPGRSDPSHLPLVTVQRGRAEPVTSRTTLKWRMRVAFLVDAKRAEAAAAELSAGGWKRVSAD